MTEIEKLDAGLPFDIFDPAVNARKLHAVKMTEALNAVPVTDSFLNLILVFTLVRAKVLSVSTFCAVTEKSLCAELRQYPSSGVFSTM